MGWHRLQSTICCASDIRQELFQCHRRGQGRHRFYRFPCGPIGTRRVDQNIQERACTNDVSRRSGMFGVHDDYCRGELPDLSKATLCLLLSFGPLFERYLGYRQKSVRMIAGRPVTVDRPHQLNVRPDRERPRITQLDPAETHPTPSHLSRAVSFPCQAITAASP